MSTPSSHNDGPTGRTEFFGHGLNPNLPSPPQLQQQQQLHMPLQQQSFISTNSNIGLQQQTAVLQQQAAQNPTVAATTITAPPTQFVHWSNPLMGGATFMQPPPQPTPAPAPQQQQQQFNDFLFNIQAQAAYAAAAAAVPPTQVPSSTSPQETYSVLRVGNGNFLKIYHCPENGIIPLKGETSFNPMTQYNQGQPTTFHHVNPQGGAAGTAPLQQQQSQSQITGSANSASTPVFNSYELFSSNTFTQLPTAEMPPILLLGPTTNPPTMTATEDISHSETNQVTNTETTNVIIHNMPNNSKNWTGGNHPVAAPLFTQFENCASNQEQLENLTHTIASPELSLNNNNISGNSKEATLEKTLNNAHIAIQQQQPQLNLNPSISQENINQTITSSSSATAATLLPSSTIKTEIPRQEAPKKRIVAEVKPMRMTYSDVLSKFNNQTQNPQQNNLNNFSMTASANPTSTTAPNLTNQRSQQKSSKNDSNNANNSSINLRRLGDDSTVTRTSSKKSPTHENKENQQQQQMINNKLNNNNQKRSNANTSTLNGSNNNIGISSNKSATTIQKNLINNSKNNTFNINNGNSSNNINNDNQQSKKQRSNKNSDIQNNGGAKNYNSEQRGTSKSSGSSAPNNSTQSTNVYNSTTNTYARKPTKSSNSGNSSSAAGQQRSRYQNNSNASYSYSSTKRRNNSSYGASSSLNNSSYANGAGNNRNYELAKRFLQAWYTYTLKILTWLFYLVYDIVVLGCSILYERLLYAYECGKMYAKQLHKDLKQNSNKPGIWFKNYCRKFDAKFSKTSKWAFWRRFYKKKPPEANSEAIKTGRLPATGEEAMYQLLNCKGKDAYSILGVPPNSSQEQIRKHYKKIAVLVHPDKNKQAGAEEAFKVLQRAFELIGEPENRLAYDQSLAEALHAEKAWTELHDLLSQLQTKITEAANTIRCSTCGLRHPRKITDRAHYAARECASCKIRHSAREGDIWAETSMLGLRWKYLALMEGKVYDITEWANCQKGALAHLEPNSHMVQYRIVRGAQQQQQQQQQQQKQQAQQQQQQHHQQQHAGSQYPGPGGMGGKFKRDNIPTSEASLHEFLDNLYSGQHPQQQQQNTSAYAGSSRRRNRRN
ncbi:ras guanine nucleotide exchange factor P [Lucilia sericata]|uniref:ras guanine nucleotide exchange factor P n=1 Tax=Lucilia sericata TaxID=13632 RepID=UPI0018A7F4B4|nr:ras guanine nucleotide exchange factor P [Lucilia sericata]